MKHQLPCWRRILLFCTLDFHDISGKRTGGTGLMIPLQLSEELVNFLGTGETSLARSAVIKQAYVGVHQREQPSGTVH
jgi:hypothetical protein